VTDSEQEARLVLARRFREQADRSSEQDLRDALSRSYYALYHAGIVLLGKAVSHREFPAELEKFDTALAQTVSNLQKLRSKADYDPEMVSRDYASDLELFRLKVGESLEEGRGAFQRLLLEIAKQRSDWKE